MFGSAQSPQTNKPNGSVMDRATAAGGTGKAVAMPGNGKIQHSIISSSLTVTGDIITAGDLTVEGTVDGSIACRTLTLGGAPTIKGDVEAETVRVCGAFTGSISASQVHLVKSAVMRGDINYQTLTIDKGAYFEGKAARLKSTPKSL